MLRDVYEYVKDEEFRFTVFSNRVHVMNYIKIISLQSDIISFTGLNRKVIIKGSGLILNKLLDEELLIVGNIRSIEVFND